MQAKKDNGKKEPKEPDNTVPGYSGSPYEGKKLSKDENAVLSTHIPGPTLVFKGDGVTRHESVKNG
jgi:hypothetical protein